MGIMNHSFDSISIGENRKKTAVVYADIAKSAEEIVNNAYEAEKLPVSFPVDIEIIAKHNGIIVEQASLNQHDQQFSRVLAIMSRQNDSKKLIVDNHISYKTRRYAAANAIARCMLKNQETVFTSSYAIPLIPQSLEEISADVIALFMLMPVSLFKEEFKNYLENTENRPMDVDLWLSYLSDRTQISPFNLAIGYQQMKIVLCYQHQEDIKAKIGENIEEENDPYSIIFA